MSESIADILERQSARPLAGDDASSPPPDPITDAERAADDLRRQVQESNRERDEARTRAEAEARARLAAEREAQEARQAIEATSQAAVTNALTAAQAQAERLRGELRAAFEAGDYAKAADLQFELGRAGARVEQLEAGQATYETKRTETLRRDPEPQGDPVEAFLATRTPRTAQWLRANRNFFTDDAFRNKVTGADSLARGNGIKPDTDEYFDFIERTVGLRNDPPASPPPRMTGSPPPAAPVSRDAPSMTGSGRSGDLMISAEDRRIAEWMGVDPEVYARERAALERQPGALYRNGKR